MAKLKNLEKALGYKNLVANKTKYYSHGSKKGRCKIQDCEDFQPRRKLIAEELAVHLIIDIKTVKAGKLKIKLGVTQLDLVMTKQESVGLRIRKTFSNADITEDFYVKKFDYMIDFYFPQRKLTIEIDQLGRFDRDLITENKRQKELEQYLRCTFVRINPDKKDFSAYDGHGKTQAFIDKLKDEELEKNWKKKESLIDNISKKTARIKILKT